MIYKWLIIIVLYVAVAYGAWWTYEHVNAWLGIIAALCLGAIGLDAIIRIIKHYLNN